MSDHAMNPHVMTDASKDVTQLHRSTRYPAMSTLSQRSLRTKRIIFFSSEKSVGSSSTFRVRVAMVVVRIASRSGAVLINEGGVL